ncbi:general negative regulator of transcription subunit 5 [Paramarasmius palmivorus]|uniref:General negative regulator of transcription subunit n=1 Tax=Paramarasmius palmivorus TaxID=297713 RepID=A0AAW0E8R1_9AGAR
MAARKLQTEIDRTLKKVSEGVEYFEAVYEKMQASTNQTQKEKLETDLKTQIKKLQRLRDQIKSWITSNDIKDKSQLLDNRKLIETQMEKFKACEKEMKTKAFSKEGLIAATRLDPKEQEKEEEVSWLQSKVEELQIQVEQAEAEIESLQGTGKKRNKGSSSARTSELEELNERRKWHIGRLELILRLLQNGTLAPEKVADLHEDVSYFVESNTEEDFEEDDGIYDELNLDEEEEMFRGPIHDSDDSDESDGASEDLPPPRTPSKKQQHDDDSSNSKVHESPILKKASAALRTKSQPVKSTTSHHTPSTTSAPAPPAPRPPAQLPPIRYAAAAAAAIAPTQTPAATSTASTPATAPSTAPSNPPPQQPAPAPSIPPATPTQDHSSIAPSSPSMTHPSVTSPMLSSVASVSFSQQPDGSFYSSQESPAISEAIPSSVGAPAATSSPLAGRKESITSPPDTQSPIAVSAQQPQQTQQQVNGSNPQPASQAAPSPLPTQIQQYSGTGSPAPQQQQQQQLPQFPPGMKDPQMLAPHQQRPPSAAQGQTQAPGRMPGSLSDLVVSFEGAKQKAALRMQNLDSVHKYLDSSYGNMPQPQDTEKPKYYVPRHPYTTPAYYPQTPNPLLSTPAIFSQLDVETLFYVFYYLPGTYQQFLAARELKRQSWRFHIKYLTWFQRHSEPQAITEEYEQGVYVYFDWEGSWCQRKKSDFRFEYRYLSED